MNAKHTPGPWQALPEEVDKPYIRIRGTRLGDRYKIANVVTPTYNGAELQEADVTRANARLIAAAPELLAALIERMKYAPGLYGDDPRSDNEIDAQSTVNYAAIAAAVAKATGGGA